MSLFKLVSDFKPLGDQPKAIEALSHSLLEGNKDQVFLGVTGSGKTFTMAHVIARMGRPTLIIAPNKTLAAQLFNEFKHLCPENAVEYFISYYDYYQPEAYIPQTDSYIEKDASINDAIDRMRHSATSALLQRRDIIIIASVSCIYGLGSPEEYRSMHLALSVGQEFEREDLLRALVDMLYERNDMDFVRGTFRVRGDVVEIFPASEQDRAIRVEYFGDAIEAIKEIDPLRGVVQKTMKEALIYPGSHYVTTRPRLLEAMETIKAELKERIEFFRNQNRLLEAQRIEERTNFDLEMLQELGYCHGIENYSRHLTGRRPGEPPPTLLDYFPKDFLLFIDESHITVPQLQAMYRGDRSRKETLVEYGFRLPSALDNRPLNFAEFERHIGHVIYVSATPGPYELKKSGGHIVEQIIRPTGLTEPKITVKPASMQVDDLLEEIRKRLKGKERVLVTTLTKRMSEDLAEYYAELGLKVKYLHSDIATLERAKIIRDLRLGVFDVLIGINLLREGLDLPEVSLVAILDADKEGFLRSERSLIQTCGRTARNVHGEVILYADHMTSAIKRTIEETDRRRKLQSEYNCQHHITPTTIKKSIKDVLSSVYEADYYAVPLVAEEMETFRSVEEIAQRIKSLEKEMLRAAKDLDFERAAEIRDRIRSLKEQELTWR